MPDIVISTICIVAIILSVAILILVCRAKINMNMNMNMNLKSILPIILATVGNKDKLIEVVKSITGG